MDSRSFDWVLSCLNQPFSGLIPVVLYLFTLRARRREPYGRIGTDGTELHAIVAYAMQADGCG